MEYQFLREIFLRKIFLCQLAIISGLMLLYRLSELVRDGRNGFSFESVGDLAEKLIVCLIYQYLKTDANFMLIIGIVHQPG